MTPLQHPGLAYRASFTENPEFLSYDALFSEIQKMTQYSNYLKEEFFMRRSAPKEVVSVILPSAISLEESEEKMKKNLLKCACEHWNIDNKKTIYFLNITRDLDSQLLNKMESEKGLLNRVSIQFKRIIIDQFKDSILSNIFLSRATLNSRIQEPWTILSLKREWASRKNTVAPYISPKALEYLEKISPTKEIISHFSKAEYSNIGHRPLMEDAYFCINIPEGILSGIFDGHRGSDVATYVSTTFKERFSATLTRLNGHVHETFRSLFNEIEEEISKRPDWLCQGSTALVSFVNKKNVVFTATAGDSEANIYRRINGHIISIPLSIVRNWSCPKEAKRAAQAFGLPLTANPFPETDQPKSLRFLDVNFSRSLGDLSIKRALAGGPGLIHKPKITMCHLEVGDLLVLASDGLKDYVNEKEILRTLNSLNTDRNPAEALGRIALSNMTRQESDNISIITLNALLGR